MSGEATAVLAAICAAQARALAGGDLGAALDAMLAEIVAATDATGGFLLTAGGDGLDGPRFDCGGERASDELIAAVVKMTRTGPAAVVMPGVAPGAAWSLCLGIPVRLDGALVGLLGLACRSPRPAGALPIGVGHLAQLLARFAAPAVTATTAIGSIGEAAILAGALDSVITIDVDGRIVEFNTAAQKAFGYRRADVVGRLLADCIIPPELRGDHLRGLRRYLATGHGAMLGRRLELAAMRVDGTRFPCEMVIQSVRVDGRQLFTAFLRDIADRIEMLAAVRQERDVARQAAQDKTRLLAEAGQEIRGPVAAILGNADAVAGADADGERARWLRALQLNARELLRIGDDLRGLALAEEGKLPLNPEPVHLRQVLDDLVAWSATPSAVRGVEVSWVEVAPLPAQVVADGTRLRQILANLIGWAIPRAHGGQAILAVGAEPGEHGDLRIHFAIRDKVTAGQAEPARSAPAAFARDSIDRHPIESGVGIAITRRLIERMGGQLTFEAGSGGSGRCSFWIRAAELGVRPPAADDRRVAAAGVAAAVGVPPLPVADPSLEALLERYLDRLRETRARMNGLIERDDLRELAVVVHRLKGSAGSYGFPELTAAAMQCEEPLRAASRPATTVVLQPLLAAIDAVLAAHGR